MFSWKISAELKLPGTLVEKKIELGKLLSTCSVDSKDNTDVYSIRPERLNNGVASNRIAGELKNEM